MNKTQKQAWFNLAGSLLALAVILYILITALLLKRLPSEDFLGKYFFLAVYCAVLVVSLTFMRKKQSLAEPDFDERDIVIKQRAIQYSYVSVWLIFFAACVSVFIVLGLDGYVPVFMLPLALVLLFLIVQLIYCVSILLQYRGGRKDGE